MEGGVIVKKQQLKNSIKRDREYPDFFNISSAASNLK